MTLKSSSLRDVALHLLAMRDHTERELALKLRQRGFSQDDITALYSELRRLGYLDDVKVGEAALSHAVREGRIGPMKFQQKLRQRGFDSGLLNELVTRFAQEGDEQNTAFEIAEVMSARGKLKGQIARALQSRGFSTDAILKVLAKLHLDNQSPCS